MGPYGRGGEGFSPPPTPPRGDPARRPEPDHLAPEADLPASTATRNNRPCRSHTVCGVVPQPGLVNAGVEKVFPLQLLRTHSCPERFLELFHG